jgi:hypothetical protein
MDIINDDVNKKEDATSIRAKNEALLTAGMGYGNKKKAHLEAFWNIILPGLLNMGWKTVGYSILIRTTSSFMVGFHSHKLPL